MRSSRYSHTQSVSAAVYNRPIVLCVFLSVVVIPRLHDQAGSTSCYMLAGRASSMFARCLLDRVNGVLEFDVVKIRVRQWTEVKL